MSIFGFLGGKGFAGVASKAAAIIDKNVTDKDLANQLKAEMYLAELQVKSIPWVDGLHKMGRQILALAQIGFYAWAVGAGVEITPQLVAGVSGVAGIYTLAKGRGQ